MGDAGWREQPKQMTPGVLSAIAENLPELAAAPARGFSIVLHGGEPLLIGVIALTRLLSTLRRTLPSDCDVHVQTNGVLLNDRSDGAVPGGCID
jgi:uncharacterized protein